MTSESTAPPAPRLGWIVVYVPDVEQALTFYASAFSLPRRFVVPDGTYGELETGATALAFAAEQLADAAFTGGVRRHGLQDRPGAIEVCLVFDDVDAAYRHAVAQGCTSLAPPTRKPHGQDVAWVRDPWGTLLEICSPVG